MVGNFSSCLVMIMTKVKIRTKHGDIVAELWDDESLNTVKNFVSLAKSGYYDGLTFHRVVDNFVVQGGDPKGTGTGGPGYKVPCETEGEKQVHVDGAFSMAHAGRDTGGSQFFIVLNSDNCSHLDGRHTVFGKTIEGMDVVRKIKQGDKMLEVEVLEVGPSIEEHKLKKL